MSAVVVRAIGVLTGWGRGVAAIPPDPRRAAEGRAVIAMEPAPRPGDRLRRATRECRVAIDAVEAALADGGLGRADIAGAGTALVYVTAAAYGASNRAFVEGGGGALHFPYTAPSAVPAEVAIEFGLHGPYAVLIGGAATTIDAIEHAAALLARGACQRAIVLAVETFTECADLLARAGVVGEGPLVEAAVAALLVPGTEGAGAATSGEAGSGTRRSGSASTTADQDSAGANQDFGGGLGGSVSCPPNSNQITLACAPLIDLATGHREGTRELRGRWRGREAVTTVGVGS